MKTLFLAMLMLLAVGAAAQTITAAGPQDPDAGDPPTRAGRIAYLQGAVELRPVYDAAPAPAELNWPLTSGNVIATGDGARAELRIGSTALRLDGNSELEIAELSDDRLRLRLLQGSLAARVRNPQLAPEFELNTAQGRLTLAAPSQIRADAGLQPGVTSVTVFAGAARFDGAQALTLVAGQRAIVAGSTIQVGAAARDDFDFWSLARDQQDEDSAASRYLSPETTGYEVLDQYGAWDSSDEYGAIWVPHQVPDGWAPYRDGRWVWIAPWGWTWIDRAPWGYAPFHYGRWAWLQQRWCWVPGPRGERPAWAPALVGWVGGEHWQVRFADGSAPAVGWFPLAPRQAFAPAYAASSAYRRRFVPAGDGPAPLATYREYLAHDGVTVLPRERFRHGATVAVGRMPRLDPAQPLAGAPLADAPPPRPSQHQRRPPVAIPTPAAPLATQRPPAAPPPAAAPVRPETPHPDWRAQSRIQPVQPVQPMQPIQPIQPMQPVQPMQPMGPGQSMQPPHPPPQRAPLDAGPAPRPHPHPPPQREWRPAPGAAGLAVPPGGGRQRGDDDRGRGR